MRFELTNEQRAYFGLEPIKPDWKRVILKGDTYREESILYFDNDTIKRHIISTDVKYKENQYNELTKAREILLPKTVKGKEKKLTASVLESRQPTGVYCFLDGYGKIGIASYATQTTFYDSYWERNTGTDIRPIKALVEDFIKTTPEKYLLQITAFKKQTRENIKFRAGDFFVFRINREEYGFGRVLLNIGALRKENILTKHHGLNFIMTQPVLVKLYAYTSRFKQIELGKLETTTTLPSSYMMDNLLFYGQFEIIGHRPLKDADYDFPISYGRHIDFSRHSVFLQWGLIHLEQPVQNFNKYLVADNPFVAADSPSRIINGPFRFSSVGFYPHYFNVGELKVAANAGAFDFEQNSTAYTFFDLRNPRNLAAKNEIMKKFGLEPDASYDENCKLSNTISLEELRKII